MKQHFTLPHFPRLHHATILQAGEQWINRHFGYKETFPASIYSIFKVCISVF
jgi:hypothetical protein